MEDIVIDRATSVVLNIEAGFTLCVEGYNGCA